MAKMMKSQKEVNKQKDTKERILDAAHHLFTTQGFAATSMAQVAQLAEVNHSLIFHHFGNKQGLWEAVRHAIVIKTGVLDELIPSLDLSFYDFIYTLLKDRVTAYRHDPALLQIVNWQRIEKNVDNIGIRNNTRTNAWLEAFLHYQKQEDIAEKYKPEFIFTLIFAIVSNAAFDPNVFIKTKRQLSDYLHFCTNLVCKSLRD